MRAFSENLGHPGFSPVVPGCLVHDAIAFAGHPYILEDRSCGPLTGSALPRTGA